MTPGLVMFPASSLNNDRKPLFPESGCPKPGNEKGPSCDEPKSLYLMVPAPRVELGTY